MILLSNLINNLIVASVECCLYSNREKNSNFLLNNTSVCLNKTVFQIGMKSLSRKSKWMVPCSPDSLWMQDVTDFGNNIELSWFDNDI